MNSACFPGGADSARMIINRQNLRNGRLASGAANFCRNWQTFITSSNHLFSGTIQAWDIHWEDI